MVTPVTTNAAQQQPIQNNRNEQNFIGQQDRRDDVKDNQRGTETRPAGTSVAEAQQSETRNNGQAESPALQNPNDFESLIAQGAERGSVLDLSV